MPVTHPLNEVADRDHLLRMAAGDVLALRKFYETHVARVFGFARRMLGDEHEAEEVTQDVFVRAWRRAREFDPERASPWGWLAMMTRSICLDRLRRRRRRPDLARAAEINDSDGGLLTTEPQFPAGDLPALLQHLRPIERACLTHVFFDGLTLTETAMRTGVPLGSAKTYVRRALQRLRETLSRHDS